MDLQAYKELAQRLDAMPNGFPPTPDGAELRLLAKLFTPEEAALAAKLRLTPETAGELAERIGGDAQVLRRQLKTMGRKGLITVGKTESGLGYSLMPFVVGIYEMQAPTIDEELAYLLEDYFQKAFAGPLSVRPQFHRIVPVGDTVSIDLEISPYESVVDIVSRAKAWGVLDCLCRKQQALIGKGCDHPLEVCMSFSDKPGAFDGSPYVRALTLEEALEVLHFAAESGLVHSVSNTQADTGFGFVSGYICNCCTCSCGLLRGMSELGIANVIARSTFVNEVDADLCIACGTCIDRCQFNAITVDDVAHIDGIRCVGCGVCVLTCPSEAMRLVKRPADEILPPPKDEDTWRLERSVARGIDIKRVL
jgi:electron transport complex protein RnfB